MTGRAISIVLSGILCVASVSAANITVFSSDPFASISPALITTSEPRNGNGSVDMTTGSFFAHEFFGSPGPSFGLFSDFEGASYEALATSGGGTTPQLALRFYNFGDPRSFFLLAPVISQALGSWQVHDVFSSLVIQSADGNTPPASFGDIPPDAPLIGIHFRTVGASQGFADTVVLTFNGTSDTYNYEVDPASIPEPSTGALMLVGFLALEFRRRRASN